MDKRRTNRQRHLCSHFWNRSVLFRRILLGGIIVLLMASLAYGWMLGQFGFMKPYTGGGDPDTSFMLLESGDQMLTEGGDNMLTEDSI